MPIEPLTNPAILLKTLDILAVVLASWNKNLKNLRTKGKKINLLLSYEQKEKIETATHQ